MRIALIVGHNEKYQGAVGDLGLSEWQFNNQLVDDILAMNYSDQIVLKKFLREPIKSYSKQMKILHKQLKEWGTDVAISFHFNASIDAAANGHLVLYCKGSKKGKKLAKLFDNNFDLLLNNKDRNIEARTKRQRGGLFLCKGKYPCILLEPFFAYYQSLYERGSEDYSRLVGSILLSLEAIPRILGDYRYDS